MLINGKESKRIKCRGYVFAPNFHKGNKNAEFRLIFIDEDVETKITSSILKIHRIEGSVFIETQNSLYEIVGNPGNVKKIEEYMEDPNFTSEDFLNNVIPNMPPNQYGWCF